MKVAPGAFGGSALGGATGSALKGVFRKLWIGRSPFGQDRLVPIYLATLAVEQKSQTVRFRSGAEMLETFGMQKEEGYKRLVGAFERIFGATIFFGTDTMAGKAKMVSDLVSSSCGKRRSGTTGIWSNRLLKIFILLDPETASLTGGEREGGKTVPI